MMNFSLYLGFIVATFILLAIPGPNVMMILAKSTREGTSAGLIVMAGMTIAQAVQIIAVVLGLSWVVHTYPDAFEVIQLGGAAYLIYLGISSWLRAGRHDRVVSGSHMHLKVGFFVGLSNPKSLLFMAAFFPQFIDKAYPADPQLTVMGVTYLVMAILIDGLIAVLGGYSRNWLSAPSARFRLDRVSGAVLVCAGLVLAFLH
ncbi:Homoserine/homoserine lactone efflux protein [Pseudovibrio sp. Ad13]|uniref:LysE family translocator n=1 Tax=Pseudovibrio sp. Ad13 TaxID=989396 RepID=UPI0007B22F02|nr:LysE family translocator [Pseudovibrio sp. Ad13]KZK85152.1 Homoserine/homoserine lactone efflux protein [Pseudovibrio sp. Ad13]